MKKAVVLFFCLFLICISYLLYSMNKFKEQTLSMYKNDAKMIQSYANWGYDTKVFSKMYTDFIDETNKTSLFVFPFTITGTKNKHDNILRLLQGAYATKVSEKKELIQSKLTYLRNRVKSTPHLSPEQKLAYSDTFEVIAGTVFEENASLHDFDNALKSLETQDTNITKDVEVIRKESIYTEISEYKRTCSELGMYFVEKKSDTSRLLTNSCIAAADRLLGPGYKDSGADFIESLGRERVFALVQKATQAKQQIIQDEQYSLLQKKREEERLTLVPPSPRQEGKIIVVNIGLQRLYAYENGKTLFSVAVPITTGKYGFETVYGEFAIYLKERMHQMRSPFPGIYYDDIVNYWMPFYLGYGLHDAPWRTIYGTQDYSSVGSHGCVNMPFNETSILYNWAEVGTRVIVI